jgi:hypothetical protein
LGASKTAVPTAAIRSCARTRSPASGSSEPSGSFAAGSTTPSQSSSAAVKAAGSTPSIGRANRAAPIGASDGSSQRNAGTAIVSSSARASKSSRVIWLVVYGAIATSSA